MKLLQQFINTLTGEKAVLIKHYEFQLKNPNPKYGIAGYATKARIDNLTYIITELELIDAAMNVERMGLLQKFWGRTSDACPLECTEHEAQLAAWEQWILDEWAPMSTESPH